ncbi:glycosyltransferase family 4 protein [Prochlorothrix hollandica]|uniref:Glycosyl transferase n=1 Tax=Prochlorothrix hollandica PCC 9006 = CALU 1027 TaxID=317619 RepID=A0A0M2PTR1_PROHO|nr:glycosyltransferase family 4 protein [Prochlorothrix hollandica]KKI98517.1 glycosyl transferase [Prochlorothrix hollandica PCC 9006 = CALU 1027]
MKLAVITSHPIQYYAPWFRYLNDHTEQLGLKIKIFYLWDFGVTEKLDVGFKKSIQWDIPLLEGYEYEFVTNLSKDPGTHHFWGLQNPNLFKQVYDYQPNAVLLMTYNYASLYQFIWSWKKTNIPLVFRGDSHRLFANQRSLKFKLKHNIIKFIYKNFSAFLYVGKANYDYFRIHGVPIEKLFFAPHSVNNDYFFEQAEQARIKTKIWKQELQIAEDNLVILFAGKLEEKKRPLDLLTAFTQANLSNTTLLFVGDGELDNKLKNQAKSFPNVKFAPFQNQSLMPRTYAIADLFVLPSYSETWGLAVNEAMCLSRPIIVSDHVGCASDLVIPDQNGLIFPAGNINELAQVIKKACANKERLKNWGKRSREIINDYSYERLTNGLLQSLKYLSIIN